MRDYSIFLSVLTLSFVFLELLESLVVSLIFLWASFFNNNIRLDVFGGIRAATTYLPSSFTKLNTVHALTTGITSTEI